MPLRAADPYWHCKGPVSDCSSADHAGNYGCADAWGVGSDEARARDDGAHDCALQLRGAHGGDWNCANASRMTCEQGTK
jgi:hypothetical protein